MRKIPTWLKIVVPLLLLLVLLVGAAARMWFEEVPEQAQAEAIQARFAEQIAVLEELAGTIPISMCDVDEVSVENARELIETLRSWKAGFKPREGLFADPAILGVKVSRNCDDSQMSFTLKEYDEPAPRFSRSMVVPPTTWPAVSLWFSGRQRVVKYEDRFETGSGETMGFHLTLAPEHL